MKKLAGKNPKKRRGEDEPDGEAKRARVEEPAGVAPLLNSALGLVAEIPRVLSNRRSRAMCLPMLVLLAMWT